jgi:hypothetical protein
MTMERSTDAVVAGTTASDQISREELQLAVTVTPASAG